jgi:predicted membrane metal-binding protein
MSRQEPAPLPRDRSFGLTFAIILGIVGAWMLWKASRYAPAVLAVAGAFLLLGLAIPRVLHPLNVAWMWLGGLLNRIVSPIVMGAIFFGLLTPLAAVLRLRGRDVLQRRFDSARATYWIRRDPPGPDGSSFPRQF